MLQQLTGLFFFSGVTQLLLIFFYKPWLMMIDTFLQFFPGFICKKKGCEFACWLFKICFSLYILVSLEHTSLWQVEMHIANDMPLSR